MVEAVKQADKQLNKGEAQFDANRKEVMYKTSGGNTIGVGHDAHHDDTGVVQMAQTIGRGEMPSNAQIENTIEKTKMSLDQQQTKLSDQGRRLAQDAKRVLDSAEQMLENKNEDESLQKIVKEANNLSREGVQEGVNKAQQLKQTSSPVDRQLLSSTISNTRDLVWYLIRSTDFRGFMFDLIELFQSIAREADDKYGDRLVQGMRSGDSGETAQNVGQDLKEDLRRGDLGDDQKKQSLEDRFEFFLTKLSNNPQYNMALNNIFELMDQLRNSMDAQLNASSTSSTSMSREQRVIIDESWNILTKFVEEKDLNTFNDQVWGLYKDMQYDMDARQFFWDLRQYLLKLANSPDQITDQYRKEQAKDFVERAKQLFRVEDYKYRERIMNMFDTIGVLMNQIRYDPDTQQLTESVGQFAKDFFTDDQGRPDLFVTQESIQQLRDMIIPILQKQLENVPLPMIEGTNDKYDWRLENVTLYGRDILPDTFDIKMTNNAQLGHSHKQDKFVSKLKVSGKRIRLALTDFNFWYHRKTMPKIEDSGIADLKMLGNGLSFKAVWKLYMTENRPLTIKLDSLKVWIDKLDINVKKSHHSFLNKLATKLFSGTIKRRVGEAIVQQIRSNVDPLNEQLNDFFRRERDTRGIAENLNAKMKNAYEQSNVTERLQQTKENIKGKLSEAKENVKEKLDESEMQSTTTTTRTEASGRYANIQKDTALLTPDQITRSYTEEKEETFTTENPFEDNEQQWHASWKAKYQ